MAQPHIAKAGASLKAEKAPSETFALKSEAMNCDRVIPEDSANIFSVLSYEWMTQLFILGSRRPLQIEDIWQMPARYEAKFVTSQLEDLWSSEKELSVSEKRSPNLSNAIRKLMFWPMLWAGFVRALDVSYIISPLFIGYLIKYVAAKQSAFQTGLPGPSLGVGMGYAVGIFLLTLFSTIITNRYFHIANMQSVRIKAALNSMIFEKATRLSAKSRLSFSSGKVTTLISTDVIRIENFLQTVNQIWLAPLQIVLILFLLIFTIGPSALVGVGILLFTAPFTKILMGQLRAIRVKVAPLTDERIKIIQEVLQGIRVIKFFTWEKPFTKVIQDIRVKEVAQVLKRSLLNAFLMTIVFSFPILGSTTTFVVYSLVQPGFSAANIFSSLAWFAQLRFPLMFLPSIMVSWAEYGVAVKRIQELLEGEEVDEARTVNVDATYGVEVKNGNFIWDTVEIEKNSSLATDKLAAPGNTQIPPENIQFKLTDINFSIPKGSLVAIVGPVGSGKSSLLNALISEMKRVDGTVEFCGKTGYAAQQAWIKNDTIKENILFGQPYDETRFLKAIHYCALERDLEVFDDGDLTAIGERGINLSGGQKQRINLARMVYFNADVLLMDDPLSAVDAHVGKYLFEKCIKGALGAKTRILVTHQLQFLPKVDHIIVMNQGILYYYEGKISEQGTFATLMKSNGAFSSLLTDHGGFNAEEVGNLVDNKMETVLTSSEGLDDDNHLSRINKMLNEKHEVSARKLMEDEERASGQVSSNVWKSYMYASGGIWFLVGLILLFAISQCVSIGTNFWLVIWSNQSIPSFSQNSYIAVYMSIAVLQAVVFYLTFYYFSVGGTIAAAFFHRKALVRVLKAPIRWFDTVPIGRIINRFSKDQDGIDSSLVDSLRMFLTTLANCVGIFAVIIYGTPLFAIPLLPILVGYYYIQRFYRSISLELKRVDSLARSPLYSLIGECLVGLPTIRAYSEEARFVEQNSKNVNKSLAPFYVLTLTARWLGLRLESLGALLVFFAAIFGVTSTDISPALFGLTLSYSLQVVSSMNWCVRQFTDAENAMNAVERMQHYGFELEQEAPDIVEGHRPSKEWPTEGRIEFKNVDLKYAPELPLVLNKVSFNLEPKEKVGVCGRTGSGKSTLIQALFRMVEPAGGEIIVDGIITRDIGLSDLRSKIGIIPQDPVMFSGAYRRNLDPFNKHTDEELWSALDRARMKDKCVESGGLDSLIAEGGENLSVGQRQLVCLARAMLTQPKIFIMDEATANVDFETDSIIQACLREDMKNSTILTIAHRLNTIVDYNRILVLDGGQVVEFDTPKNLMAKQDGVFRSMVVETGAQCLEAYEKL